ncbi:MAG: PGF-CTERM sorting domain-containing protein [Azospirillaceae bacterium]
MVGLGGLALAASSGSGGGTGFGLVVAIAAVLAIFYLIKNHFDAREAGDDAVVRRAPQAGETRAGAPQVGVPFTEMEALMPKNPMDALAIAMIFGILSLGGIPVATYAAGFGSWFGIAMFLGCGAVAGLAALSWWRMTFDADKG